MKIADLEINWPKSTALIVLTLLLFWGYACKPQATSLINPEIKVTRPELQIELQSIIATAEFRLADLDKQQAFQDIIFKNATLIIETGTLNPAGIITLMAGLYGIARGTKDLKDKVLKKKSSS